MEVILKCPKCGRVDSRWLIKKKKHHCNPCGYEWERVEEEEKCE